MAASRDELGRRGEDEAVRHLKKLGYRIVGRRERVLDVRRHLPRQQRGEEDRLLRERPLRALPLRLRERPQSDGDLVGAAPRALHPRAHLAGIHLQVQHLAAAGVAAPAPQPRGVRHLPQRRQTGGAQPRGIQYASKSSLARTARSLRTASAPATLQPVKRQPSTVAPVTAQQAAGRLAAIGVDFVDAPLTEDLEDLDVSRIATARSATPRPHITGGNQLPPFWLDRHCSSSACACSLSMQKPDGF